MTAPVDLNFIARQLERLLAETRSTRDEIRLIRDELFIMHGKLNRLDDTLTMNVLDRLRALEAARGPL